MNDLTEIIDIERRVRLRQRGSLGGDAVTNAAMTPSGKRHGI